MGYHHAGLRVLLLTPPMTQLNTPYPATAYLVGFLRQHAARIGFTVAQDDPALTLFLRLFSREGLTRVFDELPRRAPKKLAPFVARKEAYLDTVDAAVR